MIAIEKATVVLVELASTPQHICFAVCFAQMRDACRDEDVLEAPLFSKSWGIVAIYVHKRITNPGFETAAN